MTDLKPCPMPIDGIEHNVGIVRIGAQYWCRCTCGVGGFVGTEKQAVTAWNTRTPDTDWQPIETAPKDGTIVRGRATGGSESRVRFLGNFGGGRWCYVSPQGGHAGKAYGIKEWKPLDEPPKE